MKTFSRTLVTGLAVLAMICPAFAKDKTTAESA